MKTMRLAGALAGLLLVVACSKKAVVAEETYLLTEAVTYMAPDERAPAEDAPATQLAAQAAVSTFSIDVDSGSYSLARHHLREGRLPEVHALRTEEFLNYFDYDYPLPASAEVPFSTTLELAPTPWAAGKHLLLVGLKGYEVPASDLPPANLVFLIDTSGSMDEPRRLPLLKQAFRDFASTLRPVDRVSIVAYAGSPGLVLPATAGDQRSRIVGALESLAAGGATDGGSAIRLAYRIARENFVAGGINRVILATDGDFNVGLTTVGELESLIAVERKGGVSLTVLGFGYGGMGDGVAEKLADAGNGNYAFVDDDLEADKVLRREVGATLLTIAADVKVQVEFNPNQVESYRLIGYANRVLAGHEFRDDRVDAGEIGAGHDVTALYEVVLAAGAAPAVATRLAADEIARVRVRYKTPGEPVSRLLEQPLVRADLAPSVSDRLRFAAAVAAFGERLAGRGFESFGYPEIAEAVRSTHLPDPHGERMELADLAELAGTLAPSAQLLE